MPGKSKRVRSEWKLDRVAMDDANGRVTRSLIEAKDTGAADHDQTTVGRSCFELAISPLSRRAGFPSRVWRRLAGSEVRKRSRRSGGCRQCRHRPCR